MKKGLLIALDLKRPDGSVNADSDMKPMPKPASDNSNPDDGDNEQDEPLPDDESSEGEDTDVEFALPEGVMPPSGSKPGDSFTLKATCELTEDGKCRLVAVNGQPLGMTNPGAVQDDSDADIGSNYASQMAQRGPQ